MEERMTVQEQYAYWGIGATRGNGKNARNWVLISDMVADGRTVYIYEKIDREKMVRYLVLLGRFETEYDARIQIEKFLKDIQIVVKNDIDP
jgi:predicted phosphodiesterase